MISFSRYAALLSAPAIRYTLLASLIGRLPIGITGLAILLFVQTESGSFARGGAATACYVGGLAALAPALGRLIDRHGPRGTLLGCSLLFPGALLALVAAVHYATPNWQIFLLAGMAGASFPPITVCMRTFFKQQLHDDALLGAAYSLESVVIETVFVIGPVIVALFVAAGSTALAVLFAAACGSAGAVLFTRSPALRSWRAEPRAPAGLLGPLTGQGFIALMAVVVCFSSAFGLLEIGITAYATEAGEPALAGVLLGLMSAGSALGGLTYGSRSWRLPLWRQFVVTLTVMGIGLGVLALGWNAWLFAVLSVFAGVVMAPAMTIQSMLVAKTARPEYVTEAFTWSASALLCGVGIGLAAGGALLEQWPSGAVLGVAAAAALLAAVLARLTLRS